MLKAVSNSGGGGSGTPGGSTTQVQYNNAGAFAGATNVVINADGSLSALTEVIAVSGTTKTLALTDANTIQDCSNASAQTITIPLNASVAFPTNTVIVFEQNGAGAVTVVGTSGVTVNGTNAGSLTTAAQYSPIYARKEATDTWYIESGASAVQSISNSDGTLTISPTSGAAVASLALAHANIWTASQTFNAATSVTLGTQAIATGVANFKGTTSGTVSLSVADAAGTWTAKLPITAGTNKQFMQTDGSGNMTWAGGTAGLGVPYIQASGRTVGATAAVASVATFTVGAADGTFEISANVLVTTATTHAFTVTCAYTDEGNTSRVLTLQFSNLAGTFLTSIANAAGTVPYEGAPLHIRCKTGTTITIASAAGGVYTSVVYNIEAYIRQLG